MDLLVVLILVNHAGDLERFFKLILEIRLSGFTDTDIPKQLKKKKKYLPPHNRDLH